MAKKKKLVLTNKRTNINLAKELGTGEVIKIDDIKIEEDDERVKQAYQLIKNIIEMEDTPNFLKRMCKEALEILAQKDLDFDIRRDKIINIFENIPEDLENNIDSFTRMLIFQLTAALEQL